MTPIRPLILSTLFISSISQAVTLIPSDKSSVKDLAGEWHFKLEQGSDHKDGKLLPTKIPAHLEPFQTLNYKEDASWKKLAVPSSWEMHGFSPAIYYQPDNTIGIYRQWIEIPSTWAGKIVKINFDGVQNGAEVYLNGQPVNVDEPSENKPNYHQGGNDAFQADLTPAMKPGQKNLLAIRVYHNPLGADLDSGDFFILGGVYRPVTLFCVPQTHIEDVKFETTVAKDGSSAQLRLHATLSNAKAGDKLTATLEGFPAMTAQADAAGHVEFTQTLDHPKLWSAEHPNLYTLTVDLPGSEKYTQRVGVREVSIENGVFMVNHVPVKLAGMCRHNVYPTLGTSLNEEVWRKDITLMKAANVNAIRTSHYPYGSKFYSLCDELGMYVADEMAAGWVPVDKEELAPFFAQHARELVRRDKNHPSVVIWAIGNENGKGFCNKLAADEIRKLDTTRPRLVSTHDAEEGNVELDDRHYTNPAGIKKDISDPARREKIPMIYLENPNVWDARNGADWGNLDQWAAVLDRTWDVVWHSDHIPGSFLWEWQDRSVADPNPTHFYDYYPKTGINMVKAKGIVDGFRNPRPTYYALKMVYAPIKVDITPVKSDSAVTVHATNYYSFTDLSDLTTTWHLLSGDKEISTGKEHPKLAPLSNSDLKFEIPDLAKGDSLRLDFDQPDGSNVVTYQLRLSPETITAPKLDTTNLADLHFPHFNLVAPTYASGAQTGWNKNTRHRASLTHITVDGKPVADEASLEKMPLSQVHSLDADVTVANAVAPEPAAKLHAAFDNGKFSYKLEWLADKPLFEKPAKPSKNKKPAKQNNNTDTDIQEVGWIFSAPPGDDHFSWHHQTYWSWYPQTNIGRPTGTATPDSMNVDITKITRPDAFDFGSTKYHCDYALLTRANGAGIGVLCDPSDRQQIRAGTNPDGTRQLVVNRYACPPHDISSNVLPDYYLSLSKGKSVESSFTIGNTTR